ncbi:MAG: transposase [Arcobacteraceae bacterium]|nr:transposase [Arcobacteraceae bacterium]
MEKINRKNQLIECFCNNFSINQTAKFFGLNYQTVTNEYKNIRENIANFLETQYSNKEVLEYDEYLYLEKSKKIKEKLFEAKNFLTFHYEDKVYNILMPNIARYKDIEPKDFSRFMSLNKISKLEKKETIIQNFWEFFENSILKYKGVKEENFFYYLKEIEFKFNYPLEEQKEILKSLV